ncbi:MAG: TPMT family class I SAM-dependent methyltransferase [Phycisphaerales bacterium]|jgi:SAM-dependent methyltransferase|nr:TPMT family class I SAM-dependent methyltransferase [Phycisphaerales bacterium]
MLQPEFPSSQPSSSHAHDADRNAHAAIDAGRLKVDHTDAEVVRPLTTAEYCERVYQTADGDPARIPWHHGRADELLIGWLNREAPRLVRPGSRAVVVGCGLGDDVAELTARGFDVIGFDVSATAIHWAALRHPRCAQRFMQADLLDPPSRLLGRFDLVVEISTLQSLPPDLRRIGAANLARLASARGVIVSVDCGRLVEEPSDGAEGPPWPLSPAELESLLCSAGLGCVTQPKAIPVEGEPDHVRVMGVFVRG